MTSSSEDIAEAINSDPDLPEAIVTKQHGEELMAVVRKHIAPVIAERDLMRDAIRLAKQRADVSERPGANAWNYLTHMLELHTDNPLIDLD